ncbi:MAG TPA: hypothetical protein PLD20_18650 [Blastocatellia bacterium]|nr:hypothetical protein [Blastocatellia bacterium]HMX25782.1 hypothetical protein [Blastocatellia bacterium]HMZ19964.1 hypothetical protein [Blastocatellia bacterium]HNG32770.1 hypothetical protein [Blastocatellia bacterium]
MRLKSKIQRLREQVESGICPLCGHDTRSDEVYLREEFQRLVAEGWSEQEARELLAEAVPEQAKRYLPSLGVQPA